MSSVASGVIARLSNIVSSINGLTGAVVLSAGANVTLTPAGNTITIASTGGASGSIPQASFNIIG